MNTINNLLILNFEEIDWDYGSDEKIELLRYKNNFQEASLRRQPYALVRANRSERAASANPKLVSHRTVSLTNASSTMEVSQLSHSSRSLSPKKLEHAEQVQRCVQNIKLTDSLKGSVYSNMTDLRSKSASDMNGAPKTHMPFTRLRTGGSRVPQKSHSCGSFRPTSSVSSRYSSKSRINSAKQLSVRSEDLTRGLDFKRSDQFWEVGGASSQRAISESGFSSLSRPTAAKSSTNVSTKRSGLRMPIRGKSAPVSGRQQTVSDKMSLSEIKSLKNSQMRIDKKPIQREKLLLEVGVIESGKQYDNPVVYNTAANTVAIETGRVISQESEYSSISDEESEGEEEVVVDRDYIVAETIITPIETFPLHVQPHQSIHPKRIASTIPKGGQSRPKTAHSRVSSRSHVKVQSPRRCKSAVSSRTQPSNHSNVPSPLRKEKSHGWTTSCTETMSTPPMLMHGKGRVEPNFESKKPDGKIISKQTVTPATPEVKNPFESHGEFHLRSRRQLEAYLQSVGKIQTSHEARTESSAERIRQVVWKAKATGKTHRDFSAAPKRIAPEIRE